MFDAKFLIVLIVTLYLNFSYGSLIIKPNYEKYKIGDIITIAWDSNLKVNNATLSFNTSDSLNRIDILNNINDSISIDWEIPEEFKNDIGYFIIWNEENRYIERSESITIVSNDNEKVKRANTVNKSETAAVSKSKSEDEVVPGTVKTSSQTKTQTEETTKEPENEEEKETKETSSDKVEEPIIEETKVVAGETTPALAPSTSSSSSDQGHAIPTKLNSVVNEVKEDENKQSGFNDLINKCKEYIFFVVGGAILAVLAIGLLVIKIFNRRNEIPNGKRSIKRFTIHEDAVPPIYNDNWKATMTSKKSYNTLTKNASKKSLDSETEQLINTDDSLISDAEKFARKHGLTDREWVARKDYIPFREDELEIYEGNRIKVFELYDDLWCYGMNLDHYGTLNNDNEGMFPSSILPVDVITRLLNATQKGNTNANVNANGSGNDNNNSNGSNNNTPISSPTSPKVEAKKNSTQYEVTIDVSSPTDQTVTQQKILITPPAGQITSNNTKEQQKSSQFTLPKPLTVPLMPPKPLPVIPNLNRSSSLRSSVHRKRNSNIIDPTKSPLVSNQKRGSQLSTHEADISKSEVPKVISVQQPPKQRSSKLFISTNNNQKEMNKPEEIKGLLSSPESDYNGKSIDSTTSTTTSPIINANNINIKQNNLNIQNTNTNNINTNADRSIDKKKDELYQQQLLIQKQREQLQQQQLEQQKLQEQLKQQQLQQQLQQQKIQQQLQQLQQMQQEKERQILQQKQQLQQQIQQQQYEQQQLRIQREQQQIIQKSKLKEIEYERERLLQASMMKQDNRDSILPSYSEAVSENPYNNFASSSSSASNMVEGFPLPPQLNNSFVAGTSKPFTSPVLSNSKEEENPELYPRNTSYKHQVQKRDQAPEVYPRNISKAYVDEHPEISRKIKQGKTESSNSDKHLAKQKEASSSNYQ